MNQERMKRELQASSQLEQMQNELTSDFNQQFSQLQSMLEPNFRNPLSWYYEDYRLRREADEALRDIKRDFFGFVKGGVNSLVHEIRLRRYQELKQQNKPVIVAEGDSWFQHPLLDDIVDCLHDDGLAVLCFSAAGDQLLEMAIAEEFVDAVRTERPALFLLSGGGNDLLMPMELKQILEPGQSRGLDANRLTEKLQVLWDAIESILYSVKENRPGVPVLMHGYDYALPRLNAEYKWIYPVMAEKGIYDLSKQANVVAALIDSYNEILSAMAERYKGEFFYLDLRGTLRADQWYDEIHPNEIGFRKIGDKMRLEIDRILGKRK